MAQREIIEMAFLRNDATHLAELLNREPPLLRYSKGYNLAHLAVVTGEVRIVKVAASLLAEHWDWLLSKKNAADQTPLDLAVDLNLWDIQVFLRSEEEPGPGTSRKARKEASDPRAQMAIEDEQQEEMYDKVGRKNQQKLGANANGKPYWKQ